MVPSTGEVLVSDSGRDLIIRFRAIDDDSVVGTLGTGQGSGPTKFDWPSSLAVLDGVHRPVVCIYCNWHSATIHIVFQLLSFLTMILSLFRVLTCDWSFFSGGLPGRGG